jgi:hypothetical protein
VYFVSCEWATVSRVGGKLSIAPTSKRVVGESFTGQVRWSSLEFGENSLEASQESDKSGEGLWSTTGASGIRSQTGQVRQTIQVRWGFLESGEKSLEFGEFTGQVH